MKTKRALAIVLSFILVLASIPVTVFAGSGSLGGDLVFNNTDGVSYSGGVYTMSLAGDYSVTMASGKTTTTNSIKVNDSLTGVNLTLNGVNINTSATSALDIGTANVNLTLTGENTLCTQNDVAAAVRVPENGMLTIKGDGKLKAQTDKIFSLGAAIGGNGVFSGNAENCGTVNIEGSTNVIAEYLAEPSCGAGIGGGGTNSGKGGSGGTVNINENATVYAMGHCGAGIGGAFSGTDGGDGGIVNISGNAKVTAKSNSGSAGIGGGRDNGFAEGVRGSGATVTISDNAVVDASSDAVGIGGWDGGNVTVNGGTVTATSLNGAGIGGGAATEKNKNAGNGGTLTVNGGTVIAKSTRGAGIGGGGNGSGSGGTVNINGGTIIASSEGAPAIGGGASSAGYGAGATVNISGGYLYEWTHTENAVYKIGSNTAFENNNSSHFVGIRPQGAYALSISGSFSGDFGTMGMGYINAPEAGTYTVRNCGNREIDISVSSSMNYDLTLSKTRLSVGDTATLTIRPRAILNVGTYNEEIKVSGSNLTTYVSKSASFEVKEYIDTPANAITVSPEPNSLNWNTTDVTVTPAAGYKISYTKDGTFSDSLTVTSSQPSYHVYLMNANGEKTDKIPLRKIQIDKTAPDNVTVSYENNGWQQFLNTITFGLFFKDTLSVKLTGNDADSGIKEFKYSLDGGNTFITIDALGNEATFNIEPQFKGKIVAYAIDNVGFTSATTSTEGFAVDNVLPTATIIPVTAGQNSKVIANEGGKDVYAFGDDLLIKVNAADSGSGIKNVRYTVCKIDEYGGSTIYDNGLLYSYVAYSTATESDLVHSLDGNTLSFIVPKEIDSRAKAVVTVTDNSDNTYETSYSFGIDNTVPEVTLSGDTTTIKTDDLLGITAVSGISGIEKVEYSIDGGSFTDITSTYSSGITVSTNGTYTVKVTNGLGVSYSDEKTYTNIDSKKPVVAVNSGSAVSGEWTNEDVTLTLSNATANLGTTLLEYKVDGGEWQTYSSPLVIDADTDSTVYKFRAKSQAGIYSDEVEFEVKRETVAPVISGVTDGETYYISRDASATDDNLSALSVGGISGLNPATLEGNKDASYVITATDSAGNVTTVTVQMKPISALLETVKDVNKDTVKFSDENAIDSVISELEALLNDNTSAITDGEKDEINGDIDVLNDAKTALANAKAVADLIDALPEGKDVKKSDALKLNEARTAYEALTAHEKSLVDASKLNAGFDMLTALNAPVPNPKTGGTVGAIILAVVMVVFFGALLVGLLHIRKKQNNEEKK